MGILRSSNSIRRKTEVKTLYPNASRIIIVVALIALTSCSANSAKRAGEGALSGAAAGAVGGMFTALIFGGDVGDAAARGAAWGAGTGAVAGAIHGSAEDSARKQQQAADQQARQEAELERLRTEIGVDAYAGLEALTVGKHDVAFAYARTAMRQQNADYAVAGRWLEVLTYADSGLDSDAENLIPSLVEADPEISSTAEANQTLAELSEGLRSIRTEFNL
jgi:hypothetical protein